MGRVSERVALVDMGAGNLQSVHNAIIAAGADSVAITDDPARVREAARIVLPGVGSFAACARELRAIPGMVDALEQRVRRQGTPFLGICVGMQLLATRGEEHGDTPGLDWIPGEVRRIEPECSTIKVPHMGWNDVFPTGCGTAAGLIVPGEAYFLHSYQFHAADDRHIAAASDHGGAIVAAVAHDNIVGVQFHPEKSQRYGLELLARFLQWDWKGAVA